MRRINLHNHTIFSDGKLSPKELIDRAVDKKLDEIAITDHYEYFLGYYKVRSNIYLYFQVLNHLKEKYNDKIKIFAGFEMDFKLIDEASLPSEFFNDLDFILFERVFTFEDLDRLIELKKNIPIRVGLAHPSYDRFSDLKKLVKILEENNIFVELNTSCYCDFSPRDRPDLPEHPLIFEKQEDFFKLVKNLEISISNDVHRVDDDVNELDKGYEFLKKMGLSKNLIRF